MKFLLDVCAASRTLRQALVAAAIGSGMKGKTVLITGGDMGLGLATATALAAKGATILVAVRPPADGHSTVAEIRRRTGNADVMSVPLELSSLDAVRSAASEILGHCERLDVLINNAGAMFGTRRESADGFEMSIAVNYLGPFLLTQLLFERLADSAPARVVNMSSDLHRLAGAFDFDFHDLSQNKGAYDGFRAYGRSKLALVLHARELARRGRPHGVSAFAVTPGNVRTNVMRHGTTSRLQNWSVALVSPLAISPERESGASVYCATEPGLEHSSGGLFQRRFMGSYGRVRECQPSPHGLDDAAAAKLWEVSERLVHARSK